MNNLRKNDSWETERGGVQAGLYRYSVNDIL